MLKPKVLYTSVVIVAAIALGVNKFLTNQRRDIKTAALVDFDKVVKPLLHEHCERCHGPEVQKANLRVDSLAALLQGGYSGPALRPGKAQESLLFTRALHNDPLREVMPKEPVPAEQLQVLKHWINVGAPWRERRQVSKTAKVVKSGVGDALTDARNPIRQIFKGERLGLWSLKPITNPQPPQVKDAQWPKNEVDRFILAKIESAGKQPAPEADRHTLVRRVYYDLTGLPPSPEQMSAAVGSSASDWYETLVDELLPTRAHAEQWGRFWLDLVRYSDSNGYDYDEFRPTAWRFRDYVIRAFQADKPFDQMLKEHLAGDEMIEGRPSNAAEVDTLEGTGYLRVGPYDGSAGRFGERLRCHTQVMSDLVETTATAFLGMNMTCAKCHDHKVDPISHQDYYRLRAIFENCAMNDNELVDLGVRREEVLRDAWEVDKAQQKVRDIEAPVVKQIRAERWAKLSSELQALFIQPEEALDSSAKEKVHLAKAEMEPSEPDILAAMTAEQKTAHQAATKALTEVKARQTPPAYGYITSRGRIQRQTHLLKKGDFQHPAEVIAPGVLTALNPDPLAPAKATNAQAEGLRTALAEWLLSNENPLTARVMANRLWLHLFGRGIVPTPNDFGLAGAQPSHPELLDWLAQRFRAEGWSMRKMIRLLMTSATYRQGLAAEGHRDADLFDSREPRRLTAEEIRDSMLAVAGLLHPSEGGPPAWPELTEEVRASNPGLLIENEEKTRGWYPSPPEQTLVRSLYLVQKRSLQLPFMAAFDQPDNNTSCACRPVSTVAPQALTLLNDEFTQQIISGLEERVQGAGTDAHERVRRLFQIAFQRDPEGMEWNVTSSFCEETGFHELCRAVVNLNEFVYVD